MSAVYNRTPGINRASYTHRPVTSTGECCVEFRGDDNRHVRAEITRADGAPMITASVTLCDRRISGYRVGRCLESLDNLAANDIARIMADMPARQGSVITKDEAEQISYRVSAAVTKLLK